MVRGFHGGYLKKKNLRFLFKKRMYYIECELLLQNLRINDKLFCPTVICNKNQVVRSKFGFLALYLHFMFT